MKKLLLFIFFIISCCIFSETYNDYNYSLIYEKFLTRDEASINEKNLINFVENFCIDNKLIYKINKINNEKDIVTNSYNIEIYLNNNKENEQIVVFCPLNTPILNQEFIDNSLSIQILLDLIIKCKEMPFNKNIIFLLSGANDGQYSKYYGINYFIEQNENINKSFVIILDILSSNDKVRFSGSNKEICISSKILDIFTKSKNKENNVYFDKKEIYSARLLSLSYDNYLSEFLKNSINCISFSNRENFNKINLQIKKDNIKKISLYFFDWIKAVDKIIIPIESDKHFYFIDFFGFNIIISETIQILFLLIVLILFIIIRIFFPHFQKFHKFSLINIFPYSFVLFCVFYLSAFLPYLIFKFFGYILKIPNFYITTEFIYLIDIFFVPLLIVIIFFEFFKKWPFPKHEYLYIYGALIISFIDLIILTLMDISLIYIYLWVILSIVFAQYNRKRLWFVIIIYIFSIIPFLLFIYDLIITNSLYVLNKINPFLLNFFYTLFIFPFVLLIIKVYMIVRSNITSLINKIYYLSLVVIILILSIIFQFIIFKLFFKNEEILNVKLFSNIKDNYSFMELSSDRPIGDLIINYNNKKADYNVYNTIKKINIDPIKLNYTLKIEEFYTDYIYYNFYIKSEDLIEYLRIYIICNNNIYPVESNLIYNKIDNYKGIFNKDLEDVYQFYTGRNPGRDFLFKVSMLKGKYKIVFELDYPFIKSDNLKVISNYKYLNKRTCFIEEMDFN